MAKLTLERRRVEYNLRLSNHPACLNTHAAHMSQLVHRDKSVSSVVVFPYMPRLISIILTALVHYP